MQLRLPLLCAGLALFSAALLGGCGPGHDTGLEKKSPMVRVANPKKAMVRDYEYFTGRTDAVNTVEVRARVTGYLVAVDFKEGVDVTVNKRLFQVDPRPYKAELDRAQGQVLLSEAVLKLAMADYSRALEIAKTPGAISRQDVDKYSASQGQAEASVQAAKASAESAKLNLEFTDVVSPIDGVIGRALVTVGNLVTQDKTLLTTIVSEDPMYVFCDVDERTVLRIHDLIKAGKMKGARDKGDVKVNFGLANEGDRFPHEATVDFVNNQVDRGTGTLQVRGVAKNPPPETGKGNFRLLTPGMFVRVRVPLGEAQEALIVPQSAIGTDQGKKFLYAVDADNQIEYRPIDLGSEQSGGFQVVIPLQIVRTKEGLRLAENGEAGEPSVTASDRIVVTGLQRLRPGMKVDVQAQKEK